MKLIFLAKQPETGGAWPFRFRPIKPVTWIAGQSIRLEIDGQERRFTIASAPYEQNITIATRVSDSDFKQALNALETGDEIDGYNIEGTFVWDAADTKRILFACGVGITPYISMLRQLHHDHQPLDATLVYANRDDRFLFGDELKKLHATHPELNLILLPHQRLAQKTINTIIPSFPGPDPGNDIQVYVSGSEAMVNDISASLLAAGVPEMSLKRDFFTGNFENN